MAYNPPIIEPILVPTMKSMGIPAFSMAFSTPMWAMPRAPPPLNTSPTFLRSAETAGTIITNKPQNNKHLAMACRTGFKYVIPEFIICPSIWNTEAKILISTVSKAYSTWSFKENFLPLHTQKAFAANGIRQKMKVSILNTKKIWNLSV